MSVNAGKERSARGVKQVRFSRNWSFPRMAQGCVYCSEKVGVQTRTAPKNIMEKRKKKTAKAATAKPEKKPVTVENPPKTSTEKMPGNSW